MKIFRYISIATISVMLIGGFFVPNTLATRPCNDGNNVDGDGCSATGQLEETYICQEITESTGWYGRYYNHSRTETDFSVPYPGDGIYRGDPLGNWTGNWYDQQFFRFNRVDNALTFGADFYPFDMAPEEFNQQYGHEYLFTVHWRAQITVDQSGVYNFTETSDDDSWVYLDGVLVGDNHGHHPQRTITGSMSLEADQEYIVDIFYAERRVYNAHMFFAFDGNPEGMTITPMPQDCENDIPTANNDSYSVDENSILVVNSLNSILSNDTDPDNYPSPLTASLIDSPISGNLVLQADGTFTYTPNTDFFGVDSFTYQAFDGWEYSNTATVNITVNRVNDVPIANNDSYSVDENSLLNINIPGVLVNDTDDNYPNSLSVSLESAAIHGNVTLNSNGSFTYTPNTDFFGVDSFTYQAFDGQSYSNTATVNITVNRVNDVPIANNDSYSVDENSLLNINIPGVLLNDTDDNYPNALTTVLVSTTNHGILVLNSNGSFTYTPNTDFFGNDSFTYQAFDGQSYSNTATVTITVNRVNRVPVAENDVYSVDENSLLNINIPGVLVNDIDSDNYPSGLTVVLESDVINGSLTLNANGSFIYIPNSDYFGSDSFTYQAFDGESYSNTASVNITVNRVNDVPIANNDSYSVDENTTLNISIPGVLVNDTDPDNYPNALTTVLVGNVVSGVLTLNPNGSFTYTPNTDFFGNDSFTYQAFDGESYSNTASVNITVDRVNRVPVAENDTYSVDENTTLNISIPGVLVNDTDPDNYPSPLTAELVSTTNHGILTLNANGSFTYTPDTDYFGSDSFTYQAFDGVNYSNTATVTIEVGRVNDIPTANNDSYSVDENTTLNISAITGILVNDTDPDNYPSPLTAVLVDNVSHGVLTLDTDGSFIYTPNTDFFGVDSFTYQAFDGANYSNTATVNLTINEVIDLITDVSVSKTLLTKGDIYPGDIIQFELKVENIGDLAIVNFDAIDQYDNSILAYWDADPIQPDLITDSTIEWHDLFSVEKPLEPGQVWINHIYFQVNPEAPAGIGSNTFLVNDVVDEDENIFPEDEGVTIKFDITELPVENITPKAFDDQYILGENYIDQPAVKVIPQVKELKTKNIFSKVKEKLSNGVNKLISLASFKEAKAITVDEVKEDNLSNNVNVEFTETKPEIIPEEVKPSEIPEITPGNHSGNSSSQVNIIDVQDSLVVDIKYGLLINDIDPDNGPQGMTVQMVDNVSHGVLALNPDGSFTYTPDDDYYGSDSFTYRVFDGEDYSNIATVTIIGNEIPQAFNDEYSINENTTLNISAIAGVLANDIDPDNYPNPLTAELVANVTNGVLTLDTDGSFIYTPNTDFFGVDTFTYQAFDGTNHSNNATTTITVNEVLPPPPPPPGGGGGGGGGSFNNNPQQASILIDEGRPTTTSSNVVLTLFATNMDSRYAPTQMLLSNNPDMTGAIWVPYSQTYNWVLESGLGQRTVYAIFRNIHGDSQKVSDDIEVIFSPQVLGIKEFSECTDQTKEGDLVLNKDDHSGDATVYYIGGDCRKYFFPDPKTYFTWYTDWSNIKKVGVNILDQHPDGGGVTYRPGTKLITHLSTSKIYAVEPGGRLTWIPSPEIAANLYGSNWYNLVQDVIEGYFITTYVKDGQLSNILPDGALVKNGSTTYYIESGLRLPFSNQKSFTDHNLKVKDVLATDVSNYSLGETINGFVNRIWDVVASVANRR